MNDVEPTSARSPCRCSSPASPARRCPTTTASCSSRASAGSATSAATPPTARRPWPRSARRSCRANPHAVIAVDEEGGDVSRLHAREPQPRARRRGPRRRRRRRAHRGRRALRSAASSPPSASPSTSHRSPTSTATPTTRSSAPAASAPTPPRVAAHTAAWTRGLQSTGVAACAKHFPGHGDTATDSHLALPTIAVDADDAGRARARPVRGCRRGRGGGGDDLAHRGALARPDRPATLSPTVLGLLRDGLRLRRRDRQRRARHGRRLRGDGRARRLSVRSLVAGCDLLCIGPDKPASLVGGDPGRDRRGRRRRPADRRPARRGRRPGAVDARDRCRAGATPDRAPPGRGRACSTSTATCPTSPARWSLSVETVANIAVGAVAWGIEPDHRVDPSTAAFARCLADGVPLVVQVRDAHRRPDVLDLLRRSRPTTARPWWSSGAGRRPTTWALRGSAHAARPVRASSR